MKRPNQRVSRVLKRVMGELYGAAVPVREIATAVAIGKAVEVALTEEDAPTLGLRVALPTKALSAPVEDLPPTPESLDGPPSPAKRPVPGSPEEGALMTALMPAIERAVRVHSNSIARLQPHTDEVVGYVAERVLTLGLRAWEPARCKHLARWCAIKTKHAILDWLRENRAPELGVRLPRRSRAAVDGGHGHAAHFFRPYAPLEEAADGMDEDSSAFNERKAVPDKRGEERAAVRDSFARVLRSIAPLPARSRELLVRYHGLDGLGTETLSAIADSMGISESRACQIRAHAEAHLKEHLRC